MVEKGCLIYFFNFILFTTKNHKKLSPFLLQMARILLQDLKNHLNQEVLIQGWVQEVRNLSKIKFIILRDRSGTMQTLALKADTDPISFEVINTVTQESVVEIQGIPKENKESKWGIEVVIKTITVISPAGVPLPIDNSDKGQTVIDKRLDHRFLDTRNPKRLAIFKIRSKIVKILTNFLDAQGFTNINTPKLTTIGVESGAELFKVDYFGTPVYLAQSPQVYKQMFVAGGFERVYEIAPVFRAEKSHTMRHLTEFTGVDFEMGFIKDHNDVMDLIESMFFDLVRNLEKEARAELELLGVTHTLPTKIPRLTLDEAKKLLVAKGKKYAAYEDLDAEGEKLICEIVKEKYNSEFVFITLFPWAVKPFYQMKDEKNKKVTKSFDLLLNGVEICSGSQREHRVEVWKAQAKEKGLDPEAMKEYLELFQYGMPLHGGAGFGLDRITQRLLGLDNVREAVLLPRDPERKTP
ncbi:MAG: aspartyl-tRNA synthetase [archaeon GW2011_AR9]|nr:MAG: aspartyl-tRNA synthetase [archaeon GW2011_AR9]